MEASVEQRYHYVRASTASNGDSARSLRLATSTTTGGVDSHPFFYDGMVNHAEQIAVALLTVARVARTRFYTPPGMLAAQLRAADPVVTSDGDRLRFESLSPCRGVYARLDLLPEALGAPLLGRGATNVDVNPPLRTILARVAGDDPMHLRIGEDLAVTTMDGAAIEKVVPLPPRWIESFSEVQLAASGMVPAFELTQTAARRFVRNLPDIPNARATPLHVSSVGRDARIGTRSTPHSVPIAGPQRLRSFGALMRFARRLTASSAVDGHSGSLWQLELADARFTVALSPDLSRGFSGEGHTLEFRAAQKDDNDTNPVALVLRQRGRISLDGLASSAGVSNAHARETLQHLAADGRIGFDAVDAEYFYRDLPFQRASEPEDARLRDARVLAAAGAVSFDSGDVGSAFVTSGEVVYLTRISGGESHCTCAWYGRHRGTRGPCKHVLAVIITSAATKPPNRDVP